MMIIKELENNNELHLYIKKHSNWYRMLNRDINSFNDLKKEYKEYKREEMMNKTNDLIDNVETISNVIKMMH